MVFNQQIIPLGLVVSCLKAFIGPVIVLSMVKLSLILVKGCVWFLFQWKRIYPGLSSFVYRCIVVVDPVIKRGELGPRHIFVLVPSQYLFFRRHTSWSFWGSVGSFKIRDDCSLFS